MRRVFADSLYWIALSHPKDQWHQAAVSASRSLRGVEVITTEEVLGEYLTAFRYTPALRAIAAGRVLQLAARPEVVVISQSNRSFQAGFALYRSRPDKGYSLVDCISMAPMSDLGIAEVLTHDAHFVQEGYILLL